MLCAILASEPFFTDPSDMKTIATFGKPEDAHLCRMHLGAGGIEAFVQDESNTQLEQPWGEGSGGVRLQVADEDFDAAKEFLAADKGVPPDYAGGGQGSTLEC